MIIDKIYVGNVNHFFRKFETEIRPLIDVRIWFLLNILRSNRQIETKFCVHIIIEKFNISNVNLSFRKGLVSIRGFSWDLNILIIFWAQIAT